MRLETFFIALEWQQTTQHRVGELPLFLGEVDIRALAKAISPTQGAKLSR